MVIHNSCTFVYAFALVCFFCLASSRKHWRREVSIAFTAVFPLVTYGISESDKIWTTPVFSGFFILFTQPFFQLKEGPGFIRYCTMKFLEEMLNHMTGWYFYFFFSWLQIALCTLSWNWMVSVDLVPYFCLEYRVIYQTNLCDTEEWLLYLKGWM